MNAARPRKPRLRLVTLVTLLGMTRVSAQSDINVKVGGDLVLELDPKLETVNRVVWKHGANLVAEITQNEVTYYRSFKERTVLEASGRLNVSSIQLMDGGDYSVEVNNIIQDKRYNVKVFEELGRPTIRVTPLTCGPGAESCTLVCELDTTQPEAVSFEWQLVGEETRISGTELIIDQTTKAANFTCWAKNPVSQQASESQKNPLLSPPKSSFNPAIVLVPVLVGIVVLAAVGFWWWRKNRTTSPSNEGTVHSEEPNNVRLLNATPQNGTDGTGGGDMNLAKTGEADDSIGL